MPSIAQYLERLKAEVPEITPAEALAASQDKSRRALLIDIRESDEVTWFDVRRAIKDLNNLTA